MRMLMGKFSKAMMPTSGSCAMSSWRNGMYGHSPICVLVSADAPDVMNGTYADPMKEDDGFLSFRAVWPIPVA